MGLFCFGIKTSMIYTQLTVWRLMLWYLRCFHDNVAYKYNILSRPGVLKMNGWIYEIWNNDL